MDTYTFDIDLNGETTAIVVVVSQHESSPTDLVYDVFQGHDLLGTIYPEVDDDCLLTWKCDGDLSPDVVADIGEKIEAVDM